MEFDVRDRTARITLNRPGALNAIDEETIAGLAEATRRIEADASIKAVVITGAGDAFSVGLDIDLLHRAFDDTSYFRDVLERFNAVLLGIEALPVPVIAAVNGLARAGGFELMLACDLVVAASDARIGDTHLAFGIVPGGGASQRLPRLIGRQRAREIILTGRWLDGDECERLGLALRAVPRYQLDAAADELAARFAPLSRACLAATKAAMNEGESLPLPDALAVELEHFMRHLDGEPTSREGYRAFVEKRDPVWP